jgi:hypothetical protein
MKRSLFLVPFWVAIFVYAPTITLPFFWDDIVHLRGVSTVSAEYIVTHHDLGAYYVGYYRPVVNLLLKFFAPTNASFWHLVILSNHLINIALVGAFTRQLRLSRRVQLLSMLGFAVFPFSYQAVIWILAWFHVLVLTLILITCVASLKFMHGDWRFGMIAVIAGSLAPFVHENGVLVTGLVLMITALSWQRRLLWVLVPISSAAAAYLFIWVYLMQVSLPNLSSWYGMLMLAAVIPSRHHEMVLPRINWKLVACLVAVCLIALNLRGTGIWTALHPKAAYFLQGISYPVQLGFNHLLVGTAEQKAWMGGLVYGLLCLVGWWSCSDRAKMLLAGGWIGLTCMPAVIGLNSGYIMSAPRLFYVMSPGIALLLALLLDAIPAKWLSYTLALVVCLMSINYIQQRQRLYTTLGREYQTMLQALPSDENVPITLINAPRWLGSEHNPFPLDQMGAVFIPDYISMQDFIFINTGKQYHHIQCIVEPATVSPFITPIGEQDILPDGMIFDLSINKH